MKILITGGSGQLGRELRDTCPEGFHTVFPSSSGMDITDSLQTLSLTKRLNPDVIINAAAYTAVDQAETDMERAFAINAKGAANIARAAAETGARLIHISTDFVFDGKKSSPYRPSDTPNPISVYGKSKLLGEQEIMNLLSDRALIIRTSWLYSSHGRNFVKTMLSLMDTRAELGVVSDQAGTPTWAKGLARAVWQTASRPDLSGILHWSDSGIASWYDFACVIADIASEMRIIKKCPKILPIKTEDYPTPARRPAYSVLDKGSTTDALGIVPPHWQENLEIMLSEL